VTRLRIGVEIGAVFLSQILALVEASFQGIATGCTVWIAAGFCVLAAGPLAFLILAIWRVLTHMRSGDLAYEDAPRPTWAGLRESLAEAKGCCGKPQALLDFYDACRARGEWKNDTPHARHWNFLLADSTKIGFVYCFFVIAKRIVMAATMEFTDGELNALLSLAMQSTDTALLIILRPFNDGQASL
jgi:hypothetical protein